MARKPTEDQIKVIAQYVDHLQDDPVVARLLALSLGRVFGKMAADGKPWRSVLNMEQEDHIVDWLKGAVASGEPWLENVDDMGRPKKLLKFSTLEQIVAEADKAMLRFAAKHAKASANAGDEEIVGELSHGYVMVRMRTPEALDRESGMMQHCIGQGAYDDLQASGDRDYLSLRDRFGKAHATMEVDVRTNEVVQMRGKQNVEPIPEYIDLCLEYLRPTPIRVSQLSPESLWLFDVDARRHRANALPDGVDLHGDVLISRYDSIAFPADMKVGGDFHVLDCKTVALPTGELRIGGGLTVMRSELTAVPEVAAVDGTSNFVSVRGERIAGRFHGRGMIVFTQCELSELATDFRTDSSLVIRDMATKSLQEVKRAESLLLESTEVTEIPPELDLLDLTVSHTPLSQWPGNVIRRNVVLVMTDVVEIPEGTHVAGDLMVSRSRITSLAGCRIDGSLSIDKTAIESLEDVVVGGSISARSSKLKSLDGLSGVNGDLVIEKTAVKAIPDGFVIGGRLLAAGSELETLGEGSSFGSDVDIAQTPVGHLPDDWTVHGSLSIAYTAVKRVPDGLRVKKDFNVSGSMVEEFGEGITVEGNLIALETRLRKVPGGTIVCGDVKHPLGTNLFESPMDRMIDMMKADTERTQARRV